MNGEANPSNDVQLLAELTKRLEEDYEECSRYRNSRPAEVSSFDSFCIS